MNTSVPRDHVSARRDAHRTYLLAFLALAGPFYVNDFANIYLGDWRWWLALDYTVAKLLPLSLIGWLIASERLRRSDFGLSRQAPLPFLITFLVAALAGILIDQSGVLLPAWSAWPSLGGIPPITSSIWNAIDLGPGLLLVGLVEELVFRAYACSVLLRFTSSRSVVVIVSSLAFGLIHWSLGSQAVLVTALIGALFMALYLYTRSVFAIALAHFAIDFVDFAGVIPGRMLRVL